VDSTLFSDSPNFSKFTPNDLEISRTLKFTEFQKVQLLSRRLMGLLLRYSFFENRGAIRRGIYTILVLTTEAVLAKRSSSKVSLIVLSETGYSSISISEDGNTVVVLGYCQSYKFHSSIDSLRKLFRCQSSVSDRIGFSPTELANTEVPLVVHIRRGDYKGQTTFGLLSEQYYRSAIDIINRSHSCDPIWVFSDDVNEARKVLSWLPSGRVKYISDVDGQSAASLMAMRLGSAYIIANSTFSWWGAFLSETKNPLVIAPDPWFIGQKEPRLLTPKSWIRIKY
jgi:hypothetical protein